MSSCGALVRVECIELPPNANNATHLPIVYNTLGVGEDFHLFLFVMHIAASMKDTKLTTICFHRLLFCTNTRD